MAIRKDAYYLLVRQQKDLDQGIINNHFWIIMDVIINLRKYFKNDHKYKLIYYRFYYSVLQLSLWQNRISYLCLQIDIIEMFGIAALNFSKLELERDKSCEAKREIGIWQGATMDCCKQFAYQTSTPKELHSD